MKTVEEQLVDAQAKITLLEAEKVTLTGQVTSFQEAVKVANIAAAKAHLTGLMTEAKLPEVAVARIVKQFETAEANTGMKEAVESEAAYIKSLTPVNKRNGAGDNQIASEAGKQRESAITAFMENMHIPRAQAEMMVD